MTGAYRKLGERREVEQCRVVHLGDGEIDGHASVPIGHTFVSECLVPPVHDYATFPQCPFDGAGAQVDTTRQLFGGIAEERVSLKDGLNIHCENSLVHAVHFTAYTELGVSLGRFRDAEVVVFGHS